MSVRAPGRIHHAAPDELYIGHGLSHAVFGGAVVSHLLGVNIYVGAGLWGFGAAVLIHRLTTRRDLHADAVIGIVTTASLPSAWP